MCLANSPSFLASFLASPRDFASLNLLEAFHVNAILQLEMLRWETGLRRLFAAPLVRSSNGTSTSVKGAGAEMLEALT